MRLKHNKKRNTAFVYEALIRELTKSIIRQNKNKQNKIVAIIKEHFGKDSILSEELGLYQTIYETREIEKRLAEKLVVEAKSTYSQLDKKKLFRKQSHLINSINKTLSNKLFTTFVPNYKSIATVYSLFNDKSSVKERVLLEERMIEQMSASLGESHDIKEPIDNIVYRSFVDKFNEKYSDDLLLEQKTLLLRYISSFSDNGLEMKIFLNEEITRLKTRLKEHKAQEFIREDEDLSSKADGVLKILEEFAIRPMTEDDLEIILKTQKLVSEIETL
jgi:hypothetical protein